jgi:hypothetical protein
MDQHTMYGLFHVLFVAPLLIFVGIRGSEAPTWMYGLLAILVVGMLVYHGYRAFSKWAAGKSAWVNLIHLLLVIPVLAWIAVHQQKTPRYVFEIALMLGFAALGYHGYYLVA